MREEEGKRGDGGGVERGVRGKAVVCFVFFSFCLTCMNARVCFLFFFLMDPSWAACGTESLSSPFLSSPLHLPLLLSSPPPPPPPAQLRLHLSPATEALDLS